MHIHSIQPILSTIHLHIERTHFIRLHIELIPRFLGKLSHILELALLELIVVHRIPEIRLAAIAFPDTYHHVARVIDIG